MADDRPTSGTVSASRLRPLTDRLLTLLARLALRGFFRRVEVAGTDAVRGDRPVLVVANHFYGMVDPVMLAGVFGRLPRFLAKSTLWDLAPVRPLLSLAGMIPVYRPEDATDVAGNREVFAVCHRVLARGGLVGIFPEGVTHDDPAIRPVRTGAARIALGAHAAGVGGLRIVPVGLVFDDKIALRSRVLARVGRPVDVGAVAADLGGAGRPVDDTDRAAVRALTDLIAARLREVAPDYRSDREARVLRRAADVALRTGRGEGVEVSLAEQEALARRLAAAPAAQRDEIAQALARYHLDLDLAGLRDRQVEPGYRASTLLRRSLATTARLVLLAPLALLGAAWNLVPYWIVRLVGRVVSEPVTKGTARLLTALVVFPVAWSGAAVLDAWDGALAGVAVFLLAPVLGLVAVGWSESLVRVHRDWRGWIGLTERRALLPAVREARREVVRAVARAERAGDGPQAPPA